MWIGRKRFEQMLVDNADMKATVKSREKEVERLEKEVDYWRGKFEAEQNRADRAVDAVTANVGAGPVSDLGAQSLKRAADDARKAFEQRERENREIFGEDLGSEADSPLAEGEIPLSEELVEAVLGLKQG